MLIGAHDTPRIGYVNTKSISPAQESSATIRLGMGLGNKRLKSLRIAAGFKSASRFAKHHDLPDSTYRSHENGTRPITLGAAKIYGRVHGQPWEYFLSDDELNKFHAVEDENSPDEGIVKDQYRLYDSGHKSQIVLYNEYDVRVAAGTGFYVDKETVRGVWPFPKSYVRDELRVIGGEMVVLEVVGDSMEPTLHSGDRVLVNLQDRRVSQPGVFVLWDGDGTVVKRLELIPGSHPPKLRRISDNPLHGTFEVPVAETTVVGRAVWFGRRM